MTRKKIALISLAAGLALGLGLLAFLWVWSATAVERDPVGAAGRGLDRVMELPDPLSLGFLGVVETDRTAYDCSGSLELETTAQGLRCYLRDCTVGTETESQTFSLYADPTQAALYRGDSQSNGAWEGVELTRPLADQAAGTAYESLYPEEERAQAQAAADELSDVLTAVTALDFAAEKQALLDLLSNDQATVTGLDEGCLLTFVLSDGTALAQGWDLPEGWLRGPCTLELTLNDRGGVTALALEGSGLSASLDLGTAYPERELSPRLEAAWTDDQGQSWTATLALTVDRGRTLAPPPFENALALLG